MTDVQSKASPKASPQAACAANPDLSKQTDYLAVARAAHKMGFDTTPVEAGCKKPRLKRFNTHPAKTLSQAWQHAHDYPHDDVGLVSRRGVNRVCWLDIDYKTVEDMMLKETGHRLPRTLTTSSRPTTAPWKKHYCFRQTPYSLSKWRTEMTGIRDYSIVENGEVPNLFDMKGVGGGGFVVAAGCCRQTEHPKGSGKYVTEYYTLTDRSGIVDVPDWLVDWVLARWRQFNRDRAERSAAEAEKRHAAQVNAAQTMIGQRVEAFKFDETKETLSIDCKRGGLVPKEFRNGFMKSVAGELATRGILKPNIGKMLMVIADQCESAQEYKESSAIQGILNGLRVGNVWISRKQWQHSEVSHDMPHDKVPDLRATLKTAAKELPWYRGDLTSEFVRTKLEEAARKLGCVIGSPERFRQTLSRAMRGIAKPKTVSKGRGKLVTVWHKTGTTARGAV
jgi:hypothetical protein